MNAGMDAPGPSTALPSTGRGVTLTVVVPCFNERANVPILIAKLTEVLAGLTWEVIFVDDDSPDRTAESVRALAQTDPRVRCLQRIGRRGLSTAVIEGMLASSSPYIAVIDGDLQHDERLLPAMLAAMRGGQLDVVVASRYVTGGGIGGWDAQRAAMSSFATRLSRLVMRQDVSDPMSGFFMITRPAFESCVRQLSGHGFKILLDLFASAPRPLRFEEIAYTFRERQHGESKLDSVVLVEYAMLLLDKLVGWLVPVRFLMFVAVGATGVILHFVVLRLSLSAFTFLTAQSIATVAAMTSNFFINNLFTFRDRRLRGGRLALGLLRFYAVCGVGAIANVGIANTLFTQNHSWIASGLAGIAVGVVWNYVMSSGFTWRVKP